jgi:hypothetical protein
MFKTVPISHASHPLQTESRGYCKKCNTIHRLGCSEAMTHCLSLMAQLNTHRSIGLFSAAPDKNDRFKTEYLFGPAKGKMFGVMHCLETDGTTLQIRAFSGQYNGLWEVAGWVPPLFEVDIFSSISEKTEKQIKAIGRKIDRSLPHSAQWLLLRKKRRKLSQDLMRDIHSLYRLTNFRGETASLYQAYSSQNGIPTGTGDCCAPKLLNYAAKNNLAPLSLAEFYWGLENKSGSRQHGSFYSSCEEKCEPILGFMLCGIDHPKLGRDYEIVNRHITT